MTVVSWYMCELQRRAALLIVCTTTLRLWCFVLREVRPSETNIAYMCLTCTLLVCPVALSTLKYSGLRMRPDRTYSEVNRAKISCI